MTKTIRTRFAPSPTTVPDASGNHRGLHLGGARQALYSYLFAKKTGGCFYVRNENTDILRSSDESMVSILDSLSWLGIHSDLPIVKQSERTEIYREHIQKLLDSGHAYKCYCTPEELEKEREICVKEGGAIKYNRACLGKPDQPGKPFVVRLKLPDHGSASWKDLVLNRIRVLYSQLSDPILQRADGSILFLLSNCVDDFLQGTSHVIRGADGLSHTNFDIPILQALGYSVPEYGHCPFVLAKGTNEKLSKRNGDASVLDWRDKGYLPEAVINGLARIGWSYNGSEEIFSMEDLIAKFDITKVSKSAGELDPDKFENLNAVWIKKVTQARLVEAIMPFIKYETKNGPSLGLVVDLLRTRARTLVTMADLAKPFYQPPDKQKYTPLEQSILTTTIKELSAIKEFSHETVGAAISSVCAIKNLNLKHVGPVLRMAILGVTASPPIVDVIAVLGKEEVINRLS